MVNIDAVYQSVQALANKEQRGYLTPQEFNLFANQAQKEIFEQYFYDLAQSSFKPGVDFVYADIDHMIDEKLRLFERSAGTAAIAGWAGAGGGGVNKIIPDYVYRVSRINYNEHECEILRTGDFQDSQNGGPLTMPTDDRPIANIRTNVIRVKAANGVSVTPTGVFYFKIPDPVSWGYFVVGNKALYDGSPSKTSHFQLHAAEETELIYKVLKFAGISMKRIDVAQAAQFAEQSQVQQEKQ